MDDPTTDGDDTIKGSSWIRISELYLVATFSAIGVAGSLMSLLVANAANVSLIRMLFGWQPWPHLHRALVVTSLAGAAFFASAVVMVIAQPEDTHNYSLLLQRLPFLLFIPLTAGLGALDRRQLLQVMEIGSAIGALAAFAWAVHGLLFGLDRVAGGSGNPGPFATTCAILFSVCVLTFLRAEGRMRSAVFGLAAIGAGVALLASGMRTLYPMLPGAIVVALILMPAARRRIVDWRVLGAIALALAIGVLLAGDIVMSRFSALQSDLNLHGLTPSGETSLGKRLAMWHCATDQIGSVFLQGMGGHDALAYLQSCTDQMLGAPLAFTHFHNAALNALMFGGLFELAAVAGLIFAPWLSLTQSRGDGIAHCGYAILACTTLIYKSNGALNLMLGHDIHDLLLLLMTVTAMQLIVGAGDVRVRRTQDDQTPI